METKLSVTCQACGEQLIEYERENLILDDDKLVKFCHTGEQGTNCAGYFQARLSELAEPDDTGETYLDADEELLQAEQEAADDREETTIATLYAEEEPKYEAEALANLDPAARHAYDNLRADIPFVKFALVVAGVCDLTSDPQMAAAEIADFIDGGPDGWPDASESEHNGWLQSASVDDIVSWIVAGQ
jgi:hypothetical protein